MTGPAQFNALVVRQSAAGTFTRAIEQRTIDDLPPGELLVRVAYSSLNYKDALSASGNRGVTRQYPHTPGIDAAGTIVASDHPDWTAGDELIVTGHDLGMNTAGGFAGSIRVPAAWAVPLPAGLDLRESMILGTAGFTAAQSVSKLIEHGMSPGDGEVLVTGATGGVGCVAVAILARLGYRVVAATGKAEASDWLRQVGAATVIGRDKLFGEPGRALLKSRWAAVIDTVGGELLAAAIRATRYRGIVTCCGNVGGVEFPMNVYPFILRGVTLAGIDSANCPAPQRYEIWERLATAWKPSCLDLLARQVELVAIDAEIDRILAGHQRGRVLVRIG